MLLSPAMQAIEDRGCEPSRELWVGTRVINHPDHLFVIFASNASLPVPPLCEMCVRKKEFVLQKKEIACPYPPPGKQF